MEFKGTVTEEQAKRAMDAYYRLGDLVANSDNHEACTAFRILCEMARALAEGSGVQFGPVFDRRFTDRVVSDDQRKAERAKLFTRRPGQFRQKLGAQMGTIERSPE